MERDQIPGALRQHSIGRRGQKGCESDVEPFLYPILCREDRVLGHYHVAGPDFVVTSFAQKFMYLAFSPQMSLWIGWTAIIGGLLGSIVTAIFHPGKHAAPAAA